jgi:hypothetical protein
MKSSSVAGGGSGPEKEEMINRYTFSYVVLVLFVAYNSINILGNFALYI